MLYWLKFAASSKMDVVESVHFGVCATDHASQAHWMLGVGNDQMVGP